MIKKVSSLISILLFCSIYVVSQDLIIMKNNIDTIKCKILDDKITFLKYKKFNTEDTLIYSINQDEFEYYIIQKQLKNENSTEVNMNEKESKINKIQISEVYDNNLGDSKIIIYRPQNAQGFAIPFRVIVNDTLKIKIRNNTYYEFSCRPGEYNFRFDKYPQSKLNLRVEENKIYYLRISLFVGFWSGFPELLLVDSISAKPIINGGKIQKLKSKNEILIRPKNRIGASLITGGGFDGWTAFTATNGTKAKISFGSGFGYEFTYGREFNKWLDISLGYNYKKSSLSPKVDKADITFERNTISITPAIIIPIYDGDYMRFKLGGGMDFTWPSLLVINTSQYQNGINDRWTYDQSYGFHLGLIYEMNFTKYFSLQYGIRLNKISYQFIKGNLYYPIDEELIHPNGSGIETHIGFNIHF